MLLNQAQAKAVYDAMCALNNVSMLLKVESFSAHGHVVRVAEDHTGVHVTLNTGGIVRERNSEQYPNQSAFATAYGLA